MIGGDIHSYWTKDPKLDFDNTSSPSVAREFVSTSLSSYPEPYEATAPFVFDNPHVKYIESRKRGYVMAELTGATLTARFRARSDVRTSNATVSTLKTFVIENGTAGPKEV